MTRILVTNIFNLWNHGENLSLRCVASSLKPNSEIALCCPYGIGDERLLPDGVKLCGRANRRASGIKYYANVVINAFYLIGEIRKCDVVLDAGGDTICDEEGVKYTFAHCFSLLIAHFFSKPVIVLPQTILPFKHKFSRWLAKAALNNSLAVFVREKETYDYLKGSGIKVDEVSFDPAFLHERQCDWEERNSIGINCSKYLYKKSQHHNKIPKIVKGLNVVYVPHVLADESRSDYPLCVKFSEQCEHGLVFACNAEATRSFMSTLKLFVGERYHSIVSALSTYTPVLAVSNSFKVKSLMKNLGLEKYLIDPFDRNFEITFERKLREMLDNHAELKKELQEKIPRVQNSVCGLLERIGKCIAMLERLK